MRGGGCAPPKPEPPVREWAGRVGCRVDSARSRDGRVGRGAGSVDGPGFRVGRGAGFVVDTPVRDAVGRRVVGDLRRAVRAAAPGLRRTAHPAAAYLPTKEGAR
ncbi:hypothetical protein QE412_002872 [Microbacterium trichothecenolyticum]|uniref:Uncharacterized protein n=1 Tax=Microbacterium trichothecenolyticum TaxID=69370 RepID=A0ABU0TXB2_MICTR|nr:hypothetical protein [Microbacterium trichothecenolyticum]